LLAHLQERSAPAVVRQNFLGLVGQAPVTIHLFQQLKKAARAEVPIFLTGETGTGKELAARALHLLSKRREKPFVPVNVSTIPPTLFASEILGHVKGAFTGAAQNKRGLVALADGGVLFLDEVADIPLEMQAMMLRLFEDGEYRPVGSTRVEHSNALIISATNRNLQELVKRGEFRKDLFYRLRGLTLRLPALRERREDIPLLVHHFLNRLNIQTGRRRVISPEALELLAQGKYPGNVRQLRNMVQAAYFMSQNEILSVEDFLDRIDFPETESASGDLSGTGTLAERVLAVEGRIIAAELAKADGNWKRVAEKLGVSVRTLHRRMSAFRQLNINPMREE
jgi:DNA-binding NtrC family response regulator